MTTLQHSQYRLDTEGERLWHGDQPVQITSKAFQLLRYLISNPNRLLTKDEILEAIWPGVYVTEGLIKEYVHDLRLALGDDPKQPRFIETVRGRGYRFLGGIEVSAPMRSICASKQAFPPAVAVLPFDGPCADAYKEYLAKGITEDIRTELSRFHSLRVVASDCTISYAGQPKDARTAGLLLGAHYLVTGSVRRADDRVRITAQLVETTTGNHLWAERYDRQLATVFDLQDEIAQAIATSIVGRLRAASWNRVARKLTEELQAYDYVLLAQGIVADSKESNQRARQAYQRAAELDSSCAAAHSGLAHSYAIDGHFGYEDAYEEALDRALSHAVKAVCLDNADSESEWVLGHVLSLRGELEHAQMHFEHALELNPLDADARVMKGLHHIQSGSAEESVACCEAALRLNPYYPGWYVWNLGAAYYATKRYHQAQIALKSFTDRHPGFLRPRRNLAATLAQLGRVEEAQCVVEGILACDPNASLAQEHALLSRRYKDWRDVDHWLDGMRKAGFPE